MTEDMLPTEVDGVAVIAVEDVQSGLSTPERPVVFTRQAKLLLEDERVVYGCRVCGHVEPTEGQLRGHLRAKHPQAKPLIGDDWKDMPLGQVVAALQRVSKVEAEMAGWKQRALTAERDLAVIRRVMGGQNQQ